ncbi:hypothetical protein EJ110_NYTH12593 [Nymphaea thermarum]|nr:hypothetical protein EJ110_NYTH12593 [Nymphaea thermarum]
MANSYSSSTQWNTIAALVSVKLTRDNYLLWSSQLESVMVSQELVQFIDGTLPPPREIIMKDGKSERRDLKCSNRQCPTLPDPIRHYHKLNIKLPLTLFEDTVEVDATLGVGKEVDSKDEEDNLLSSLNHSMNIRTTM